MEQAIRVHITSTLHQGYYRAGLAIAPDTSELRVSPGQCAALEADPRLVVSRLADDASTQADAPLTPQDQDAAVGALIPSAATAEPAAPDTPEAKAGSKGKGK
ncbi:HI1506-related protein [Aeromonas diversa]|uniref:HI1506-related protein n=1 Tax=Aeromonas diversa TaxID=502790 RepID=UPI00346214D8